MNVGADPSFVKQLASKLKEGRNKGAFDVHQHKIRVHGTNAGTTHTINEDERTEFTRHINSVMAGDVHIGNRLPIPTDTMQLFDECRGTYGVWGAKRRGKWLIFIYT